MLYEQMYESAKQTRRRSISAGTTLTSATSETSWEENPGLEEKLRAVEEELKQRKLVGTLDEPQAYFGGIMRMRRGSSLPLWHEPNSQVATRWAER